METNENHRKIEEHNCLGREGNSRKREDNPSLGERPFPWGCFNNAQTNSKNKVGNPIQVVKQYTREITITYTVRKPNRKTQLGSTYAKVQTIIMIS